MSLLFGSLSISKIKNDFLLLIHREVELEGELPFQNNSLIISDKLSKHKQGVNIQV